MMSKTMQMETRKKIIAARAAGDKSENPRDLWISLYGSETPAIEDFADVFRSVLDEEANVAEDQQSDSKTVAAEPAVESKKKA